MIIPMLRNNGIGKLLTLSTLGPQGTLSTLDIICENQRKLCLDSNLNMISTIICFKNTRK